MDIKLRFSFQIEKKALRELITWLKNPVKFFEENRSNQEDTFNFLAFLLRIRILIAIFATIALSLYVLIRTPVFLQLFPVLLLSILVVSTILFLAAKIISIIVLVALSNILNLFCRLIVRKNNISAAERVVAYNAPVLMLGLIPLPYVEIVALLLKMFLDAIGVSRQYKTTFWRSSIAVLVAAGPTVLFIVLLEIVILFIMSSIGIV